MITIFADFTLWRRNFAENSLSKRSVLTRPEAVQPKPEQWHQHPESQGASSNTVCGSADDCPSQPNYDLNSERRIHDPHDRLCRSAINKQE